MKNGHTSTTPHSLMSISAPAPETSAVGTLCRVEENIRRLNTRAYTLDLHPHRVNEVNHMLRQYYECNLLFVHIMQRATMADLTFENIKRMTMLTDELRFATRGCQLALDLMSTGRTLVTPLPTLHAVMIGAFTPQQAPPPIPILYDYHAPPPPYVFSG